MAENSKPENSRARKPLTQERLKELLDYDPESGIFTRRSSWGRWGRNLAGSNAGGVSTGGYCVLHIDGAKRYAHILAYLYANGTYHRFIDHIDGNRLNNRISNLRPCTMSQNIANSGKRKSNTSGYKGVHWDRQKNRWIAQITRDRRAFFIGYFCDPADAHVAYCAKANEFFGEFARTE